ncbi:proline-rich receptor-like protein kinase PERK15 [Silene latifolia]|uniref:proline-rich receptor-like protein kinase PERK15 n=1 Tax=Silene latifolia TaxID=37657 RepID=UPI003D78960C
MASSENDNESSSSSSDSPSDSNSSGSPTDSNSSGSPTDSNSSPPSDTNSSPTPPSDQSSPTPPSPPENSDNNKNNNDNTNGGGNNNNNNDNNNNINNNDSNNNDNNNNNKKNDNNNNNNNGDNSSPSNNNNSPNSIPSPQAPETKEGFRSLFLSPPKSSHRSSSSSPSSSSNNNAPMIIGLVVGFGVLFLLLIIILVVCCCKRKKHKRDETMQQYYRDPSKKGQSQAPQQQQQQQHYSGQHAPWQSGPSQDMNYGNPSGMSINQWGAAAPMMSAEMTAGYSSGPTGPALPPPHPSMALGFNKSSFTYDELAAATDGFAQSRLLGQGGFGYVHKGVLPNGKEIAVKSLKSGSGQGEREFQAEVEIISRVHHRHLVSLAGYCIAGGQRMLVYEFVPNGTLEYHLHGKGRPVMDFPSRMSIALGSAKGLAYLHEDCHPRIIHRDIKTANILIDLSFEAKVADFGLAKLSSDTQTHVSTRIMGTFGYLAPEYASSGKLTEKSDVFSFGIMLLELVTGRRPIDPDSDDEDTLVDWARPLISRAMQEGVFDGLVDPRLEGNFDRQEMLRLIACAGSSVKHSAKRRPKMSQIVRALEGDVSLEDLNEGTKSAGGNSSKFSSSGGGSSDYDTMSYNNDMKQFRKTAFSSTEYASSDYGNTNEYGHV